MTILINEDSASASEVLTGALCDYGIAKTVGVTSYGKGVVQDIFPLSVGDGGLKVTVSKYYSPKGKNVSGKGIEPDYKVELSDELINNDYSKELDNQYQKAVEVISSQVK